MVCVYLICCGIRSLAIGSHAKSSAMKRAAFSDKPLTRAKIDGKCPEILFSLKEAGTLPYTIIGMKDLANVFAAENIPPIWWTNAFTLKVDDVDCNIKGCSADSSTLQQKTVIGQLSLPHVIAGPRISRRSLRAMTVTHGLGFFKEHSTSADLMASLAQHASAGCQDSCNNRYMFKVVPHSHVVTRLPSKFVAKKYVRNEIRWMKFELPKPRSGRRFFRIPSKLRCLVLLCLNECYPIGAVPTAPKLWRKFYAYACPAARDC